jgi:hypothetical protein
VDSQQGSGTEIHIPVLNYPHERIPSPPNGVRVHRSQQSQATITPTELPKKREVLPAISITKPPAPLPVGLPTPQDIAPLPSPPESLHFDDDLEAGRGHGAELSMSTLSRDEDLGFVTATRRTGKSKSPIQRESSDTTASSLPLPPTPPGDLKTDSLFSNSNMNTLPIVAPVPVQAALTAKDVPDLLTDPTPGALEIDSAPTLKPSPSLSSFSTGSRTPQMEKETNMNFPTGSSSKGTEEETFAVVEPVSTIRLIGGGGQSGVSQSPVKVTAEEITLDHHTDSSSPHSTHFYLKDLSEITPVATSMSTPMSTPPATESAASGPETSDATPVVAGKKGHKKSKGSLVSLKRFSVGALGKKKDSASSVKDVLSPSR